MSDPKLLADAEQEHVEVSFITADKVQAILARLYEAPPDVTDRVKKALASN